MLTTILAIWGAVLSTVAVLWNINRDFLSAGRLKVRCFVGDYVVAGLGVQERDLLVWQITNVGKEPVVLTHIGGDKKNGHHLMLTTRVPLPKTIQPGEYVMEYTNDLSILSRNLKSLYAIDSLGRQYTAPRKEVEALISKHGTTTEQRAA